MKMVIKRFITEFDRRRLFILLGGISFVIVFLLSGNIVLKKYRGLEKSILAKKKVMLNFVQLKEEYLREKDKFDYTERRALSPRGMESPIIILEEIGIRAGIKEKIIMLKPLEEEMEKGYLERGVNVKIDGIDLNQLINFLYIIENNKALLLINGFSMKSRFDNPNLLDVDISLAVISKVSGEEQKTNFLRKSGIQEYYFHAFLNSLEFLQFPIHEHKKAFHSCRHSLYSSPFLFNYLFLCLSQQPHRVMVRV